MRREISNSWDRRTLGLTLALAAGAGALAAPLAEATFTGFGTEPCQPAGVQATVDLRDAQRPTDVSAGYPIINACPARYSATLVLPDGQRLPVGDGPAVADETPARPGSSAPQSQSEPAKPRARNARCSKRSAKAKPGGKTHRRKACRRRR